MNPLPGEIWLAVFLVLNSKRPHPREPFKPRSRGFPRQSRVLGRSFTAGTTIPAHLQRARFNGLSLLDLNTLQPLVGCPLCVMFALVLDIVNHPRHGLRAKAYDAIAGLPLDDLAVRQRVVHVVGARSLQLPDPLADQQGRRRRHSQVNVVVRSADRVDQHSGRLQNPARSQR